MNKYWNDTLKREEQGHGLGGVPFVSLMSVGPSDVLPKNRRIQNIHDEDPTTTEYKCSWADGAGPRMVRINVKFDDASDILHMVFDAPDVSVAEAWLTDGDFTDTDCEFFEISAQDKTAAAAGYMVSKEYFFSDPLTSIHFKLAGTAAGNADVLVEAL